MNENEIRIPGSAPIPLYNYIYLIKRKQSPYYDIVEFLLQEMEFHYRNSGVSEVTYTINPRILQEEIERKVKKKIYKSEKLTSVNVCRTIRAMLYEAKLKEDEHFFVTTTSRGRRNYHVKVSDRTLTLLSRIL